jgi:hypothetical protein
MTTEIVGEILCPKIVATESGNAIGVKDKQDIKYRISI